MNCKKCLFNVDRLHPDQRLQWGIWKRNRGKLVSEHPAAVREGSSAFKTRVARDVKLVMT